MHMSESLNISTACFSKKGEYVSRAIAGETIIVPVRGQVGDLDSIYNLNEVGAFIWERIDGRTEAGQIAAALAGEYEVTPKEAEQDTVQFIGELQSAGIIERTAGAR
jgi:hypothetical protein